MLSLAGLSLFVIATTTLPTGTSPFRDAILVGEHAYVMGLPEQLASGVTHFDWVDDQRLICHTQILSKDPEKRNEPVESSVWLYQSGNRRPGSRISGILAGF